MGNTPSITEKPIVNFGSVLGKNGKFRPGYYFGNNKIIYKGKEITKLENETDFQKMKYGYLKSNKRVFYNGNVIPLVNSSTFSVLTRNNVKTLSKFPEKNEDFKKLNSVLGMDFVGNKKRIFYRDRIIHEEL